MSKLFTVAIILILFLSACTGNNLATRPATTTADSATKMNITVEDASYQADTTTAISYVAYNKDQQGTRPVVLVLPEWWGLYDYTEMRARELAKLGYFAMAVDIYGQRRIGENPEVAGKLSGPFYTDTALVRSRLSAALAKAVSYPQADGGKVAMIGYCFGGAMSLMGAKLGLPLRGVVSFHGNLKGNASKTVPILICHGEADKFVSAEEVAAWRKSMDSMRAPYTFKSYPGATHAFTNPTATATGKKFNLPIEYNAAADSASWNEMRQFFKKIF